MNDIHFTKGIENIKKVTMTAAEKRRMVESILASRPVSRSPFSQWDVYLWGTWKHHYKRLVPVGALAGVMLLIGGSLTYAAEGTLPGDVLYPFKIAISEPVRGFLAIGLEAEARWHVRQSVRRMQEVEKLVVQGTLDLVRESQVKSLLKKHAQDLGKTLDDVRQKFGSDAVDSVVLKFQAQMNGHAKVLDVIKSEEKESKQSFTTADVAEAARESARDIQATVRVSRTEAKQPDLIKKFVEQRTEKNDHASAASYAETVHSLQSELRSTAIDLNAFGTGTEPLGQKLIESARATLIEAEKSLEQATVESGRGEKENAGKSLFNSKRSVLESQVLLGEGLRLEGTVSDAGKGIRKNKND
ncbi:MAG: hypothetical protein AAB511_02875 [Patescibacteria group bacterium]